MDFNIFWIIPLFFLFVVFLFFDLGKFLKPSVHEFKPKISKKSYNFKTRPQLLKKFDKVDLRHKYVPPPVDEETR